MVTRVLLTTLTVGGSLATEEVGLISVATVLRERGYTVRILDCDGGRITDEAAVSKFAPDVFAVGIYSETRDVCLRVCDRIKVLVPGVIICAGGYFPTYYGEELLREASCIDFVVRGEGELNLLAALEHLKDLSGVPGITYRQNGTTRANPGGQVVRDLNALPFPIEDAIYSRPEVGLVYVSSSRGCMSHCSFCLATSFNQKWRQTSVEKVLDGIAEVHRRFGKRIFGFTDNSFEDSIARNITPAGVPGLVPGPRRFRLAPKEGADVFEAEPSVNANSRMASLAQGFLDRGLNVNYYVNVKATFWRTATPELMHLLLDSGLTSVYIGLESGNDADLALYDKGCTVADNDRAVALWREWGIYPSMGFISFNPYSTFDRLRENLAFLERHQYGAHLCFANRVILYRGIRLIQRVDKDGLLVPGSHYDDHRYRFVDPRIEQLSDFLVTFCRPYRREELFAVALPYFFEIYRGRLQYFRRRLPASARAARVAIDQLDSLLNRTMRLLSAQNTALFARLLDLAEQNWDETRARRLAEEAFDFAKMIQLVSRIYRRKDALDDRLRRAGVPEMLLY